METSRERSEQTESRAAAQHDKHWGAFLVFYFEKKTNVSGSRVSKQEEISQNNPDRDITRSTAQSGHLKLKLNVSSHKWRAE